MKTKHLSHNIIVATIIIISAGISATQPLRGENNGRQNKYTIERQRTEGPEIPAGFTGTGTTVSGTVDYDALPSKARKFLEKHCDGHAVVKCEKEFTSGEFCIQLADGIEFEFDSKGNVIETKAPAGYSLSSPLLKAVVPGKLFHKLVHNGFEQSVEAVYRGRSGYRIVVSDPIFKAVAFDPSGVLTLVVND